MIQRHNIDVVLHTVWTTSLISYLWHFLFPIPYFISVHASEILDDKRTWRRRIKSLLKKMRRKSLYKAKGIFPVSNYSAKLLTNYKLKPDKIYVIYNGVNHVRFKPVKSSQPINCKKTLLTVSRLDLHKGHDHILKALVILKNQGLTPNYIIAGEGEEEFRLRKMSQRLGLENQVSFAGFVEENNLPKVYAEADIFVMASREIPGRLDLIEGFGISLLEASASGLPVVAGNSGGVSDALQHKKTGFLVNPNDPFEIAKAIRLLLTNPELCEQLGNHGRKWVESQMNWEKVAEQMCSAIRKKI